MKFKNILMVSFLAIAGIFGMTSILVNKQAEVTPAAEKAEAVGSHTVYFATTTHRDDYYTDEKYTGEGYSDDRGFHDFSEVGKCGDYYIYSAPVYEKSGGLGGLWVRSGGSGRQTGGDWVATLIDWEVWTETSVFENKVWYSDAWNTIYTITYNPNGANGSTKTDYKIDGVDYTILSYSDAGISSHVYKHSVKWSTNSEGTETDYQPGATYSDDADLSLYYIEGWYTYQFRVNDAGDWYTLSKTGDTPDGYVAKFSAIHTFTSGDSLTFRKYYGTEDPISISPSSYEENIHDGVIYYSAGDTYIDLKLTSGNGHTIKVGGWSDRGIVIVRGGYSYKCAATYDSVKNEFHVYGITLLPGDTIKGTYNAGDPYTIYVENTDVYGVTTGGAVSTPGVFDIYLKLNQYSQFNNVYLSMNDASTAELIAQTFNEALATVCASTVSGGATSQITSAFATQKNYYDHLTSTCKTAILSGSSDGDVVAMRAKYDYIVGKYGTTIAPDYLDRNPEPLSAINGFSPLTIFGESSEESLSTIIIIAASGVALLSITALSVLAIKKRKNKEE